MSYEEEYFPGVVTDIENNEAKVLTMQKCRCGWKWPDPNDEIYYTMDNIIKQVPTLVNNRGTYFAKELESRWKV